MINVFVIEEHHEAFIVWEYSKLKGFMVPRGNTLLHIDEHADMASPKLNIPLDSFTKSNEKLIERTYSELNIANFIIPSIKLGTFEKVYWVRQKHNKKKKKGKKMYVRTHKGFGEKLVTNGIEVLNGFLSKNPALKNEISEYKYYKIEPNEIPVLKKVCLDIDLDFFSCVQDPFNKVIKIEIVKSEYNRFNSSRYHPLTFFDSNRFEVLKSGSRYFLLVNNFRFKESSPIQVDNKKILNRMESLVSELKEKKVVPQVITICRSRYSGYTPNEQWKFIEVNLLKRLNGIYKTMKICHISDITKLVNS